MANETFVTTVPSWTTTYAEQLKRDGILPGLSMPFSWKFHAFFADKPKFEGQVHEHVSERASATSLKYCYRMDHVIHAPYLWEFALHLTHIAAAYFERDPVLYSLNFFVVKSGWHDNNLQDFHRDRDDLKQLALFVFGNDVTADSGAHEYIVGSTGMEDEYAMTEEREVVVQGQRRPDGHHSVLACGPAGTAFLSDPYGLHRGIAPKTGSRMLAWARWGVSAPPESYTAQKPVTCSAKDIGDRYPTDPWLRKAIRLVVKP